MSATPDRVFDIIVVGVGGMGSAACYHLAKRGCRVLGLDRFPVGHDRGSSHGETRMIRKAYFEHPDYVPLLERAYRLWDELEAESGEALFVRNGVVIYGDPASSHVFRGTLESAEKYRIPVERLSRGEALARFPNLCPPAGFAGVYEPDAGFLFVEKAVRAHAALASKYGAEIHPEEAVLSYEVVAGGVKVRTSMATYSAKKIVIAGGGWNPELLGELKLPLVLNRMIQYWFKADRDYDLRRGNPCFAFHTEKDFYYGFPMLDGKTVKIAAHFTRHPIGSPGEKDVDSPPAGSLEAIRDFIQEALPKVSPELDRFVPCLYTMSPDEHFIVDLHPRHSDVVIAAGFSGHGFKFSTVIGEILADLAESGKTRHPIDFLRMGRLAVSLGP